MEIGSKLSDIFSGSLLSNGRSSFAVKFCSANEKYAYGV